MNIKKEEKIRKMLGDGYHLCVRYNHVNPYNEICTWRLFKKYDDFEYYISDDNKVIMSSEDNTDKELYDFAKKHYKYDSVRYNLATRILILWVIFIFQLINLIFIHSKEISSSVIAADLVIILLGAIEAHGVNHNFKVDMLEYKEEMMRRIVKEDETLSEFVTPNEQHVKYMVKLKKDKWL